MGKKLKVVSIEIELADYEPIKLTMAEAKELHEQLATLFEKTKVVEIHKHQHDHQTTWPYWYNQPYYSWTQNDFIGGTASPPNDFPTITCANDLAGMKITSTTTGMVVGYQGG